MSKCVECGADMHPADAAECEECPTCLRGGKKCHRVRKLYEETNRRDEGQRWLDAWQAYEGEMET